MQQVRVSFSASGNAITLDSFRQQIQGRFVGDARPRPRDCTGVRFLVRDEALERFVELAEQYGLHVERDEAFPVPAGNTRRNR